MRLWFTALILLSAALPATGWAQRTSSAAGPDSIPPGTVVVELDSLSVKPELQNRNAIARLMERNYPPGLRDGSMRGRVTVTFVVGPSGVPRLVTLIGSSGYTQLDESALVVTRAMRFSPPMLNGTAVWTRVQVPVVFERTP